MANKHKQEEDYMASLASALGGEMLDKTEPVKSWIDTGNLALNYLCSGRFVGGGSPARIVILTGSDRFEAPTSSVATAVNE